MRSSIRRRLGWVFALVLATVSLAALGSSASALTLTNCGTVKNNGVKWRVAAHGVSCAFAKSWLPKMVAAREREPGLWNGPPGWLCSKKHQFPHRGPQGKPAGRLVSGNCIKRPMREMAWKRV